MRKLHNTGKNGEGLFRSASFLSRSTFVVGRPLAYTFFCAFYPNWTFKNSTRFSGASFGKKLMASALFSFFLFLFLFSSFLFFHESAFSRFNDHVSSSYSNNTITASLSSRILYIRLFGKEIFEKRLNDMTNGYLNLSEFSSNYIVYIM